MKTCSETSLERHLKTTKKNNRLLAKQLGSYSQTRLHSTVFFLLTRTSQTFSRTIYSLLETSETTSNWFWSTTTHRSTVSKLSMTYRKSHSLFFEMQSKQSTP